MNFLRGLLLDNLGLKGISLLLAFLLWLQVGSQQNFQRTISVPVEFYNLPVDLEITGDYAKEVDVIIRAQRRVESVGRMSAVIDFKDARPGTAIVPLTADRNITNGPSGVEVLGIIPARLRLELERIAEKTVRVEPEIQGKPAPRLPACRRSFLAQRSDRYWTSVQCRQDDPSPYLADRCQRPLCQLHQ